MKPFDPSVLQLVRRFILVIGFSFFVVFAYRAVHEVSDRALAAGSPYTRKLPKTTMMSLPLSQTRANAKNPLPGNATVAKTRTSDNSGAKKNQDHTVVVSKIETEHLQEAIPMRTVTTTKNTKTD